jgi:exodeoxyribonuclease VII large subunit
MSAEETARRIYSVAELNSSARLLLSSHFGTIWVEGEISNLSQPGSGHLYFTLKDRDAQVRCALFKGSARALAFRPANGMSVLARAQVGLYEPRGDYQLIVDYLEEAGDGALRRAFEALKAKLAAEGLFDPARKKPIPVPPRCLGIIASPAGAAVRDILSVLARRFPALPVIIFPVKVQGEEAKRDIVRALDQAERLGECDALILARGGGSLEDLWAFNEEIVARAMAACPLPIVAGVGHETDFTIADWVADLRAPTPSAAAEAVSPDAGAWLARFAALEKRLLHHGRARLENRLRGLDSLAKRLRRSHPLRRIQRDAQRLDELETRLRRALRAMLARREARLLTLAARLKGSDPSPRLRLLAARRAELERRLAAALRASLERRRQALAAASETLEALSPLATLARGYALAARARDGKILRAAADAEIGETLEIRLSEGELTAEVRTRHGV